MSPTDSTTTPPTTPLTNPSTTPLTGDVARAAADYLRSWLAYRQWALQVPGVQAAVLLDGELLLSEAYGDADVERGVALTTRHLFRVASHSKTFTATAVVQLAEVGLLRLDDTLGRWLPWLQERAVPAADRTLREVLQHSSGLTRDGARADHWQLMGPFPDEERLRNMALDDAQVLPVGERFKYSNVGFSLLGLVVEAAWGRSYADYVTSQVLQPLGLADTGPELEPAHAGDAVVGYSSLAYARDRSPIDPLGTGAMAAATGFYSTAEDLCRYAAAHLPGDLRLLSDAGKRSMQHQWWPVEGADESGYGLGFSVVQVGARRLVGHGGGFPGQSTRTVFDPDGGLAVSVLTNAIDGPSSELALSLVRLLDLAARQQPDPGADRQFCARLANLWGVRDVALLGGRLLLLDASAADPTAEGSYAELTVEGPTRLRIRSGPGYGAVGETLDYTFAGDGSVASVLGPGGLTSWPLDAYRVGDRVRNTTGS